MAGRHVPVDARTFRDLYRKNYSIEISVLAAMEPENILVEPVPDGWKEYHHPAEGRPRFFNSKLKIVTDMNIRHENVLNCLMGWHRTFMIIRDRVLPDAAAFDVYLDCSDTNRCRYYMVDHDNESVCWLRQRMATDLGISGILNKPSRLHELLREEYWIHAEHMPSNETHQGVARAGLQDSIAGGALSILTSPIQHSNPGQSPLPSSISVFTGGKLKITPATPVNEIVAFLKRASMLDDYTSELSQAQWEEPRASGGYADVYRVTIRGNIHVAVKCMRPNSVNGGSSKAVKRTARELEAWSRLRHKNILELLGLAMFNGRLAMVSAWMELGNVVNFVNDRPSANRYQLSTQIVEAVVYLHDNGIVHGDIKGANILVSPDEMLKLTDFGLTLTAESKLELSATDESGGTSRWMSPELFIIGARRSMQTDMYALGMAILEILTGKLPFDEISAASQVFGAVLLEKRIPKRPEYLLPPSQLNDTFWEALIKCWIHDPSRRARATEIQELLFGAQE